MPPDSPSRAFASKLVQPLIRNVPDLKIHCSVALAAVYPAFNLLVSDEPESGAHLRDVVMG